MGHWVDDAPPERTPRKRRPPTWNPKLEEQKRRWFRMCLDHDLMCQAMLGALNLIYRADEIEFFPYARQLLYKWARNHHAVWGGELIGCLYSTMMCVRNYRYANLIGNGDDQYVEINWPKIYAERRDGLPSS